MLGELHQCVGAGQNTVRQMIMGAGKTAVISPLLCMLLSTGDLAVLQIVPKELLSFTRDCLRATLSTVLIKKQILTLNCTRSNPCTASVIQRLEYGQRYALGMPYATRRVRRMLMAIPSLLTPLCSL